MYFVEILIENEKKRNKRKYNLIIYFINRFILHFFKFSFVILFIKAKFYFIFFFSKL